MLKIVNFSSQKQQEQQEQQDWTEVLTQLFGRAPLPASLRDWLDLEFAQDITYELLAASPPKRFCFHGRDEVEEYLSIASASYQILTPSPLTIIPLEDQLIVKGEEVAVLTMRRQLVSASWIAVITLAHQQIQRVTVSIHDWLLLTESHVLHQLPFKGAPAGASTAS